MATKKKTPADIPSETPTTVGAPAVQVAVPPTPEAPKDPNMTDLGLLKLGKNRVFVNKLPTKVDSVVVNYRNSENVYRISAVIPPGSYTINVFDGDAEDEYDEYEERPARQTTNSGIELSSRFRIDSPTLLFVAEYAMLPKPTVSTHFDTTFYMFALNAAQQNHIEVKPYMLSNTYSDGRICMGSFRPTSLHKAFNIYWGTVFNDELFSYNRELSYDYNPKDMFDHILNFHSQLLPKLQWDNRTTTICGKNHWAANRGAHGVLVSDSQNLLKVIPEQFWRTDFNETPLVITLANFKDEIWHFESGNFKFQLPAKNVTLTNTRKSTAKKLPPTYY